MHALRLSPVLVLASWRVQLLAAKRRRRSLTSSLTGASLRLPTLPAGAGLSIPTPKWRPVPPLGEPLFKVPADRMARQGLSLVVISDSPEECPFCAPWEGRIVDTQGASDQYPSLAEAEAEGLFHPNCTHSIGAYIPGVTQPKSTRNAAAYQARQEQRRLERGVRKWKRRQAGAPHTPSPNRCRFQGAGMERSPHRPHQRNRSQTTVVSDRRQRPNTRLAGPGGQHVPSYPSSS